ncbi:hypothetical protein [Aquella oligotrophica]|uniref:Lipoprotein n=1 Tax=Aquella oligotrophica TaxID=2067065 RepID=A0A2I7N4D2_9NEIS|nr:hypothetical protein [Aquella oligotrophica]AUR51326.1 hypothetical protein CUN60_03100 [Aquella oligotrophica]
MKNIGLITLLLISVGIIAGCNSGGGGVVVAQVAINIAVILFHPHVRKLTAVSFMKALPIVLPQLVQVHIFS